MCAQTFTGITHFLPLADKDDRTGIRKRGGHKTKKETHQRFLSNIVGLAWPLQRPHTRARKTRL